MCHGQRTTEDKKVDDCERKKRIRELNDELRTTLQGGRVMLTRGIAALGEADVARVLHAVRMFSDFTSGNDPYGEHDFGGLELGRFQVIWKIDYFDRALVYGSPDPADPSLTTRVLTVK
jgi:hypothetical protein